MYKYFCFLICLTLMACADQNDSSSTKEARQIKEYSVSQLMDNKSVNGGSFSSDATKLLVSTNESGVFNVASLPVDGSPMTMLTNSTQESQFALSFMPNDDGFLFSADQGGNEITHIYHQNANGVVTDMTPGEEEKANFWGWTRDLDGFYYISNKRDPQFFDLWKKPFSGEAELLYQNDAGYSISGMSNDESIIALTQAVTTSANHMFLYNRKTDKLDKMSDDNEMAAYTPQFFSLDDEKFYYLTDKGKEFQYLVEHDLNNATSNVAHEEDWDIWYAYESWNGKYRVMGINQDAKTVVKIMNKSTGELVPFPDIDGRSISGISISRDESMMRMTAASSKYPSDIYVYNFETKEYKQLTNTLNPEIDPDDLVEGVVVRYPSFDDLDIPAVLYRPHQATAGNPSPAMVWVHGGPGGQSRLNYFGFIQALVNSGYTILAVNNRGSSGYGKTFYKMDDQKHGEVDLQDCIWGKKYLQTLDYVDEDRIGIIGGSYGGYMTMAALTFAPEEFDVGVNIFGVTNWLRTLKSTPPWWAAFRDALFQELGDPFTDDSVRLHRISPLFHAENVTKPLMVLQGANDPRVLQVESDEIVEAVKKNGVPVEYVLFPDEGHGFRKKENQIDGYSKAIAFLDTHLKGDRALVD